jgi:hypothetical protein
VLREKASVYSNNGKSKPMERNRRNYTRSPNLPTFGTHSPHFFQIPSYLYFTCAQQYSLLPSQLRYIPQHALCSIGREVSIVVGWETSRGLNLEGTACDLKCRVNSEEAAMERSLDRQSLVPNS